MTGTVQQVSNTVLERTRLPMEGEASTAATAGCA